MDLLGESPVFDLKDKSWRIYSRNTAMPPQHIGERAKISNSLTTEGCDIEGIVENSILFSGVTVEKGAYIKDSVIMSGVHIGAGSTVNYSIIDENTKLGTNCVVGRTKTMSDAITVVGCSLELEDNANIPGGAMVNSEWLEEHKQ